MKNKWLVVTDLGSFKAYRVDENHLNSNPRLELSESFENPEVHAKWSETLSDQAGQFSKGTGDASATHQVSSGERHNIELEQRKRWIRQLADKLAHVLRRADVDSCWFAAGKEINHQVLEHLPQEARAKIEKNIPSNLSKIDKSDLLRHF